MHGHQAAYSLVDFSARTTALSIASMERVRGADDVIAYHVRQSFRPGEITPEEANRLGVEFAKRFTKGNHAFVVCTHIDLSLIHI